MPSVHRHDRSHAVTSRDTGQAYKDRPISSRTVPCPTCKAEIGVDCVSANGKRTSHRSRRQMAIRALNESYSVADVEYGRRMSPRLRAALAKADGHTLATLAAHLDIPVYKLQALQQGRRQPTGPDGARYGAYLRDAEARLLTHGRRVRQEQSDE